MKNTVRMTIKEYAAKKGCTSEAVRLQIHAGKIKFSKFGRQFVIEENPKKK